MDELDYIITEGLIPEDIYITLDNALYSINGIDCSRIDVDISIKTSLLQKLEELSHKINELEKKHKKKKKRGKSKRSTKQRSKL